MAARFGSRAVIRLQGSGSILSRLAGSGTRAAPAIGNGFVREFATTRAASERTDKEIEDWVQKEYSKGWVSHGFYPYDRKRDTQAAHLVYFSLMMMTFGFFWIMKYATDSKLRHWGIREAYLALREREEAGLEPIDKNFIDPAKLELPTDEDIGDMEIII